MKGDLLTVNDKSDLSLIFARDKNVSRHYTKKKTVYRKWFDRTCHLELPANGKPIEMTAADAVELLASLIRNYDHELKRLLTRTTEEAIRMSYDRVCRLFAMNIAAGEPVKEGP